MKNIPKQIFLQVDPEGENPEDFNDLHEVSWCSERINNSDVKFLLSDVNGCALLEKLLNKHQEIISSPIRFNGVSNEDIKRIFAEFGIEYKQPF